MTRRSHPLTHVALTVRDLSVSAPWYEALFDAEPVLDEDTDPDMHHTVYLLGNTLLGLHQHTHAGAGRAVQRVQGRSRPRRVRLRRPRRAREVGAPARRAGHRPRRDQGRVLRLGPELPRPRRHRPRVLRSAELSDLHTQPTKSSTGFPRSAVAPAATRRSIGNILFGPSARRSSSQHGNPRVSPHPPQKGSAECRNRRPSAPKPIGRSSARPSTTGALAPRHQ